MCANRYMIMVKVRRPSIHSTFILSGRKREVKGSCLQRFTFYCVWIQLTVQLTATVHCRFNNLWFFVSIGCILLQSVIILSKQKLSPHIKHFGRQYCSAWYCNGSCWTVHFPVGCDMLGIINPSDPPQDPGNKLNSHIPFDCIFDCIPLTASHEPLLLLMCTYHSQPEHQSWPALYLPLAQARREAPQSRGLLLCQSGVKIQSSNFGSVNISSGARQSRKKSWAKQQSVEIPISCSVIWSKSAASLMAKIPVSLNWFKQNQHTSDMGWPTMAAQFWTEKIILYGYLHTAYLSWGGSVLFKGYFN